MAKNTYSAVQFARRKANKKKRAKNSSKYKVALEIVNNVLLTFFHPMLDLIAELGFAGALKRIMKGKGKCTSHLLTL
jgi:hypothetical protein